MRTVEDLLRAAVRETAQEIAPEMLPPAPPPPGPARVRWTWRTGRRPRWRRLAPLAAAMAVVAAIAASLTLAQLGPSRHDGTGTRAAGSIPPYYVALVFSHTCCGGPKLVAPQTIAEVKSTTTGAVLAVIQAPRSYGTFTAVSGAADDRTFVLAAQPLHTVKAAHLVRAPTPLKVPPPVPAPPTVKLGESSSASASSRRTTGGDPDLPATRFFLLRIDARGGTVTARLTALPIGEPTGTTVDEIALSPDGSALAMVTVPPGAWNARNVLQVFSTATGAVSSWTPAGLATGESLGPVTAENPGSLSWSADGRTLVLLGYQGYVRLLDTTAPDRSRVVHLSGRVGGASGASWLQAVITPDGQTLLAVGSAYWDHSSSSGTQVIAAFSARTGTPERLLDHGGKEQLNSPGAVQWASASGQLVIVANARRGPAVPGGFFNVSTLGVLNEGHYARLSWSAETLAAAW
jgi:hypothetical protein